MFKEFTDDIKEFMRPVIDLPSFVDKNKKPIDLIMLLCAIYDTSSDTDRYVKTVETGDGDMIYVLYKGLFKDNKKYILYDNLMYHGKVCQITVIDYDIAVYDNSVETSLKLLLCITASAALFFKAKNSNMFYHKESKRLEYVFDAATLYMFIDLALSIFSDTPELRQGIVDAMRHLNSKELNMESLDENIKLIKNNGIQLLLDSSLIAGVLSIEVPDEEASV